MERAYAMDVNQSMLLTDLPTMAFDAGDIGKARAYAERLLNELGTDCNDWNYGNAVHKGNLILGRIAVRERRLADAVTLLRASGETPGSGWTDCLGPTCRLPETCWSAVKRKRCWGISSCAVSSGRWAEAVSMPGQKRFRWHRTEFRREPTVPEHSTARWDATSDGLRLSQRLCGRFRACLGSGPTAPWARVRYERWPTVKDLKPCLPLPDISSDILPA